MAFVKLDCGILDSTLWVQLPQREVFVTALLMAVPHEITAPTEQIEVRSLNKTGFIIPSGWYGLVPAAGVGIIRRAMVDDAAGMAALEALGATDAESRSPEFDGRRMARIDGGYLILNYQKYRDRDYTGADRARRYRERKANLAKESSRRDSSASHRDITQEEAEERSKNKTTLSGNPDDVLVASDMFAAIQKLNAKHKQPNLNVWANDIRLMRERDNRSRQEIMQLFLWANSDTFWQSNILSPSALRRQWDKLWLQSKPKNGGTNGKSRQPSKPSLAERATNARKEFELSNSGDAIESNDGEPLGAA